jgi:hypothetical protein
MTWSSLLLALGPLAAGSVAAPAADPGLLAIKVERAETASQGTLEHAVILIENGKIVTIGEDLPIEHGIPVLDRDPGWVAMPGLVNCYSRIGMDGTGGNDSKPQVMASAELYPGSKEYARVLEAGVTTLGLYPPGNGIPGQAVAIRPRGSTPEEMILADSVYLKVILRASASSKKMLRDGFEDVGKYNEKVAKEKEKYEKDKEKLEDKLKKAKKDKDEEDEKKYEAELKELGDFRPPAPDPEVEPFIRLRDGSLRALISVNDAADYLHAMDAIGDEEFAWDLRIPNQRESNIFYVAPEIGLLDCRVVMEPEHSLHPNTMRQRNLPAELSRAGAKLVLIPRNDSVSSHESWLRDVGEVVATGLSPDAAVRAMTIEAAEQLGLGERLGSLDAGKDANMIFLNGDPFEPGTELQAVMLEGDFVSGEVDL